MSASALPASPPARAVLVTGAARRLGREISLHFARAGWDVLAHYRHSEGQARALQAEVERLGRRCHLLAADLAQPDAAAAAAAADHATLHGAPPHCIVNNASIFEADNALLASASRPVRALLPPTPPRRCCWPAGWPRRWPRQASPAAARTAWCTCWTRRCTT
ncbi:MAG: SDR family NAD(P)-dependent oxidoreductase [Ottowia sp.]